MHPLVGLAWPGVTKILLWVLWGSVLVITAWSNFLSARTARRSTAACILTRGLCRCAAGFAARALSTSGAGLGTIFPIGVARGAGGGGATAAATRAAAAASAWAFTVEQFDELANPGNCDVVTLAHRHLLEEPQWVMGRWGVTGLSRRS
ncbi:MAG: hypothetical protein ACOZQL_10075 [Myxococcota bacterium]